VFTKKYLLDSEAFQMTVSENAFYPLMVPQLDFGASDVHVLFTQAQFYAPRDYPGTIRMIKMLKLEFTITFQQSQLDTLKRAQAELAARARASNMANTVGLEAS